MKYILIIILSVFLSSCVEKKNTQPESTKDTTVTEIVKRNIGLSQKLGIGSVGFERISNNGFNGCTTLESISTTKARTTIDGIRLSGNANQMEVGLLVVARNNLGRLVIQAGYRKMGNTTGPFTDYDYTCPATVNILNNGTGPFIINGKNVFELYQYDQEGLVYRYSRNAVDILEFVFTAPAIIVEMNIHTLVLGGTFPNKVINAYPALEYEVGGVYVPAGGGRSQYCSSNVAFVAIKQDSINIKRKNEVNIGTRFTMPVCGSQFW